MANVSKVGRDKSMMLTLLIFEPSKDGSIIERDGEFLELNREVSNVATDHEQGLATGAENENEWIGWSW